jgi:hypothetical protein
MGNMPVQVQKELFCAEELGRTLAVVVDRLLVHWHGDRSILNGLAQLQDSIRLARLLSIRSRWAFQIKMGIVQDALSYWRLS